MLDAKLVVVGGDAKSGEVRLKLPTVIGRGKEAGLTVPHALVSRRHTEVFEKRGRLFVRDLGSLNGTFVNDRRINDDQPLDPNQLLTLGNVTFRAVYEINEDTRPEFSSNETVEFDKVKTESGSNGTANHQHAEMVISDHHPKSDPDHKIEFDETVPVDLIPECCPTASEEPAGAAMAPEPPINPSDGESNIFSIEESGETVAPSVSVSAIDRLPSAQPGISFKGKVELEGDQAKPCSSIDPIEIDLGDENKAAEVVGESGLGSFLNKLPR